MFDFADALEFLAAHDNLETGEGPPTAGIVHGLSLDRMRGIVDVLGNPQDAAPVIHVTGTNGKGSTVRMISAILGAHGLSVGTYTSPHLDSVTERIGRTGEPISEDDFAEIVGDLAALESLFPDRPSYFDLLTAAAFSWFAREAVDVVVVEVGMLGRYDSTNVVTADVAVVTNVGRDHTDGAGEWRRSIAEEKAGIIEDGSAVVVGETDPELVDVFRAAGALHWVRDADFGVRSSSVALGGRVLDLQTAHGGYDGVFVPLHGAHQADNAAVAVAAVEAFFGRRLDRDTLAEGLRRAEVPGRFEVLSHHPLVIVDGAHNQPGAATVVETLADEFTIAGGLTLVLGCLGRSDLDDVVRTFLRTGPRRVVCTTPDSTRAVPATELAALVRRAAGDEASPNTGAPLDVTVVPDVVGALDAARAASLDDDAVVVTGSLYTVGAARRYVLTTGTS